MDDVNWVKNLCGGFWGRFNKRLAWEEWRNSISLSCLVDIVFKATVIRNNVFRYLKNRSQFRQSGRVRV